MRWLALVGILFYTSVITASLENSIIKKNVNHSYTVKKGDTLWHVATHFLHSPWRWKELWQNNPQIDNPHLIYPGDIINLIYIKGKPTLTIGKRSNLSRTIKLTPKIRKEPIELAIPIVPLRIIEKFLWEDRIFTHKNALTKAAYVFAFPNEKLSAYSGENIYVWGVLPDNTGRYEIIRNGIAVKDPDTNEILGYSGKKVAEAVLISREDNISVVKITETMRHIRKGDKMVYTDNFMPEIKFFPRAPDETVKGKILNVAGTTQKAGKYDSVLINLGHRNNLKLGDILQVKQILGKAKLASGDEVQLPPRDVGMIMIYRIFNKMSYGVVVSAKEGLKAGYSLTNP